MNDGITHDQRNPLRQTAVLGDLPAFEPVIGWRTEGRLVGEMFEQKPHLPGVIIVLPGGRAVGLSKQEYLKHMTRPFGPEIYNRRPIRLLIEQGAETLAELPETVSIEQAGDEVLRRPEPLRYEPLLIRRKDGSLGLVDVHEILLAISQISATRARQMALILDTVPEGFLMIGPDRKILPGFSLAASAMLGVLDLTGLTMSEALAGLVTPETACRIPPFIEVLFNPALLDRHLEPANPVREVQVVSVSGREMHLGIRFKRVREGGVITQVLVMIEDLTLRKKLENEAAELRDAAQKRLEILTQLAGADPEHLPNFLEEFGILVSRLKSFGLEPDGAGFDGDTLSLRRRCHALKGEAGALGLAAFRSALHEVEEIFVRDGEDEERKPDAGGLIAALDDLRGIARDLTQLAARLASGGKGTETVPRPSRNPAETLAALLEAAAAEACERTGKRAGVDLRGCFDEMPRRVLGVLREALQQLVRNAVIHGIEPPEWRLANGKSEKGTIIVAARRVAGFFEIIVQDDGRGLDESALRSNAGEQGEGLAAHDLVFLDGVSTAAAADELAGRGIGLGQVRESILIHGGSITAHSEPGCYTAFQIILPADPASEPSQASNPCRNPANETANR